MLSRRLNAQFHLVSILVLVCVLAATLLGFAQSDSSLRRNNDLLLRQDANQAALLIDSYVPAILGNPPTQLGSLVTSIGVAPPVFLAAAAPLVKAGDSVALLHQIGQHFVVLVSAGTLHRHFDGPSDLALSTLLAKDPKSDFVAAGVGGKHRYLSEIYGAGMVPHGFALYVELTVPVPASGLYNFASSSSTFSSIDAAVYVGSDRPSNLIFSNAGHLLPAGEQATVGIQAADINPDSKLTLKPQNRSTPGKLLMVVDAKTDLSGGSAGAFPIFMLVIGTAAALLVFWLLEITMRRRDYALSVAKNLKLANVELDHKNIELDHALTKQAAAEQSLRQAQRMEAVGQLAGGIAHDFNNLLHVILSYSSFLADEAADDETMLADVAEIQTAAHRAADLTRQLLIFSRLDVSRAAPLDLNAVVADTERILRRALGEDVSLTCRTSDEECVIMADAAEIDQVLMNLTTNARDAMPQGGNLEIVVSRVDDETDEGPLPAPYVRIEVRDDGEGMSPEIAAKAFEPFFTTKETGRGTGLGLAMVYGIVTRWNGHASITTVAGRGTTVTMYFPVATAITHEMEDVHETQRAPGGDETVLLVEDEESVLRSTSRILESAGYSVVTASDALGATQAFDTHRIDVLVTDVVMPGGVSGKELADYLRSGHPELPVVFVSGYSAETIAERGVLPEQTLLVKKPFAPAELLLAVREAVTPKAVVPT